MSVFLPGKGRRGKRRVGPPSAGRCRRLFPPVPGHERAPLRPAQNAPSLRALVFAMRMRGRFRRRLFRAAGLEKAGPRFRPPFHEGSLCGACRLLFRRRFRLVRQGGTGPALCFVRRVSVRVPGRGRASISFFSCVAALLFRVPRSGDAERLFFVAFFK